MTQATEQTAEKCTQSVGALVLAAGAASRLGGRPKCLLRLQGVSLIRRQVLALLEVGIEKPVVVLGCYKDLIGQEIADLPVDFVLNPEPARGQTSSVRLGLHHLPSEIDTIVVALADQPLIHDQDIRNLLTQFKANHPEHSVLVPTHQGSPGNPVVFDASVRRDILTRGDQFGCKDWQRQYPERVFRWECQDNRYRTDIDTPEDIENFAMSSGHRLVWPDHLKTLST
ncbi:MAG: nucleotidyltransferase family protein [Burkholderiaceae bacterium]